MCSKFREAASLIASLKLGLDTRGEHYTLPRLDSALLLHWAGRMQSVHLYDETLSLPGIAAFLSAAANLTNIELDCMSSAAAARAEELLAGCTSVTYMSVDGQFTPSSFPASIINLVVMFSEETDSEWEPAQAELLVVGLSRLQQLQSLCLDFETSQPFQLTGTSQLPRLQDLIINMRVSYEAGLDLSWIQQQKSCPSLELTVKFSELDPVCHTAVLSQLLPLKVDSLCLELEDPVFPANLQDMWSRLETGKLRVSMHGIMDADWVAVALFGEASKPLQALPSCRGRIVVDYSQCQNRSDFYITWGALVRQAADVELIVGSDVRLHVLGASLSSLSFLKEPWQLCVRTAKSLHGLPPPQTTSGAYLLQNAAARAAGWTA